MKYISQKISKIFNLDLFVSMLKFNFDIKKIVSLLSVMVVSYIVMIPTYNLIKGLINKSNKKSNNKSNKKSNNKSNKKSNSETLTYRKYRNIDTSSCSGCASGSCLSSKSSETSKTSKTSRYHKVPKSKHINKKKVDKVLRKFKITE